MGESVSQSVRKGLTYIDTTPFKNEYCFIVSLCLKSNRHDTENFELILKDMQINL